MLITACLIERRDKRSSSPLQDSSGARFEYGVTYMRQEDFLKKVGVYARYLTQFLGDGDIAKIIETIRELEKIREQAEREKIED